jgi:hypothetical protein
VVRLTPFRSGEPEAGETAKILRRASIPCDYKPRAKVDNTLLDPFVELARARLLRAVVRGGFAPLRPSASLLELLT